MKRVEGSIRGTLFSVLTAGLVSLPPALVGSFMSISSCFLTPLPAPLLSMKVRDAAGVKGARRLQRAAQQRGRG